MRTQFGITLVVLLSLAALGCNERPQQRVTREPLFYVPTAAVIQHREVPVPGVASQVLPESDSYAYIPRDEKTAYGDFPGYEIQSYSIWTYDVQRIASRGDGSGYRYRMGWQVGTSSR